MSDTIVPSPYPAPGGLSAGSASRVAAADLTADGWPDLAVWTAEELGVLVQGVDGALSPAGPFVASERPIEVVAIAERAYVTEHSFLAACLGCLSGAHEMLGDVAQAKTLLTRSVRLRERTLGLEHAEVANSLYNLAVLHQSLGELEVAARLHARALEIRRKQFGPNHRKVASSLASLASIQVDLEHPRGALALLGSSTHPLSRSR